MSESLRDVVVLTSYGVDVRYPGDFPSVTANDARQALQMAERVREAVLKLLW
jgi:HEPN domain-containing protein